LFFSIILFGAPTYLIAVGRYYHYIFATPIIIIFLILLILGIVSYLRCIFTHPGCVPNEYLLPKDFEFKKKDELPSKKEISLQNKEEEEILIKKNEEEILKEKVEEKNETTKNDIIIDIKDNTNTIELKKDGSKRVCEKCLIYKPDRSHHCSSL